MVFTTCPSTPNHAALRREHTEDGPAILQKPHGTATLAGARVRTVRDPRGQPSTNWLPSLIENGFESSYKVRLRQLSVRWGLSRQGRRNPGILHETCTCGPESPASSTKGSLNPDTSPQRRDPYASYSCVVIAEPATACSAAPQLLQTRQARQQLRVHVIELLVQMCDLELGLQVHLVLDVVAGAVA
jgi:hypothetical protein